MKRQIFARLLEPPTLNRRDRWLTFVPIVLWTGAVLLRPWVIRPWCSQTPEQCTLQSILPMDQIAAGMESGASDGLSFITQNTSGILLLAVPLIWAAFALLRGQIQRKAAMLQVGTDFIIAVQTVTWNGFFTELSHLISQRPRPFVYSSPALRGIDPAHYTSFYSGHTSFSAASTTALVFILISRKAPSSLLWMSIACAQILVFLTGIFRVLAGRHFVTDVIIGGLAGTCVAWIIAMVHRPRAQTPQMIKSTGPQLA